MNGSGAATLLREQVKDGEFGDRFVPGDVLYPRSAARTVHKDGRDYFVFPNGSVIPDLRGAGVRKVRRAGRDYHVYPNGTVLPVISGGQQAPAAGGGTAAGHPQPQTSVEPPGGPFVRHSQPGRAPQYNNSAGTFNGIVTNPLVARPGYFRKLLVKQSATTSANAATVTRAADSPYNVDTLVQFKDGFGTPLIISPGYEAFKLIPLFSGGHGLLGVADIDNMPSFSFTTGAGATGGSFTYYSALVLEFAKGYGVLAAANASILPTLQLNTGAATSLYGTAPTTPPTVLGTQVDSDFYWLPEGVDIEPPGLGTTRQWVLQQANPIVAANASTRVQFPRLGGFLDTLIIEMRDSTGARNDTYWPSRIQVLVDGVPWIDSDINEIYDDMAITWPGITRPTGVIAISRKTSLSQLSLGLLDTGEVFLSTNPGSLIEVNGAPWGAGTNSPALMNVLIGQVVPTGALVQGLPEV